MCTSIYGNMDKHLAGYLNGTVLDLHDLHTGPNDSAETVNNEFSR